MRALLAVVLLAMLAWGGYWFVGARAVERGAEAFLAESRENGLAIEVGDLGVAGFPNRFDLTATGLALHDPASGFGWEAPFFQLFALSYRPNHLIAVWPDRQSLETPHGPLAIASDRMQASAVFQPGLALLLDRTAFVADAVEITLPGGGAARLAEARAALRGTVGRANHYDLGVALTGLAPDPELLARLDPGSALPPAIESVTLDAELALEGPIDRAALQGAPPGLRALEIRESRLAWGEIELRGTGRLTLLPDGLPEGRIELRVQGWRRLLTLAVAAGLVPERTAPTWEGMLAQMVETAGSAPWLELPLVFAGGRMSLGPLPLGPAPRLAQGGIRP